MAVTMAVVLLLVLVAIIKYAGAARAPSTAASVPGRAGDEKNDLLWSRIFSSGHKTNIVLSDSVYREIQYFLGRDVSLAEYLAPGYPASLLGSTRPELKSVVAFLGRQQTTSIGSATLGSRLLAFGSRIGGDPVIRYPRHINGREFKTDSFILLGSRLSIPWVEVFEPSLNFPLTEDNETHHFYLRNRAPRQGEAPEYRVSANQEETYADVAVLPNLSGAGTVLILNGIDMAGAESAGEFALNGSLSASLASMSGAASGNPFAEILIRVRVLGGTATSMRVVTTREVGSRSLDPAPPSVR